MNFPTCIRGRMRHLACAMTLLLLPLLLLALPPAKAAQDGSPGPETRLALGPNPLKLLPKITRPPEFTLPDLMSGKKVSLSDLQGRVVVLTFCNIHYLCSGEVDALKELRKKLSPDEVEIVLIFLDRSAVTVRAFMKQKNIDWPVLHDADKKVARAWGVDSTPTTFILDAKGRAVFVAFGTRDWTDPLIVSQVQSLVSASEDSE